MKYIAKWVIMALLATGCAAVPSEQEAALILAPNLRLDPPRPADMGRSLEAIQMITARHDGRDFSFEAHLSITPERVLLAGVDPMGQRVMTVTWQESGIRVDASPFLPKEVRPGSMLADIIVLYWPEAAVRRALAPSGAKLQVAEKSRDVTSADGKQVLHADYQSGSANPWSGGLRYHNFAWNYDIQVETLQVSQ